MEEWRIMRIYYLLKLKQMLLGHPTYPRLRAEVDAELATLEAGELTEDSPDIENLHEETL